MKRDIKRHLKGGLHGYFGFLQNVKFLLSFKDQNFINYFCSCY